MSTAAEALDSVARLAGEDSPAYHAILDEMAYACGQLTANEESHWKCAYCAHLASYYKAQGRPLP